MGDKSSVGDVSLALIDYEREQAGDIDIPGIRTTSSTISMFTLDNFLHLLCAKKRGQFPTTMQTLDKVFTIQQDLIFLDSIGGPVFDERYYSFVYYMNNFYLVYIYFCYCFVGNTLS